MLILNWILRVTGCSCKLGSIFIVECHAFRSYSDLEGLLMIVKQVRSKTTIFSEA